MKGDKCCPACGQKMPEKTEKKASGRVNAFEPRKPSRRVGYSDGPKAGEPGGPVRPNPRYEA